ncbi:hypothetical protein CCACVL1_23120 [Corchorus capsularis]|uniref:BZIP domain-containing protein n=1 Tax=Corchorus capsularis TaxID=210143 RepID=A0A1R3GV89_COCAP|nr:hypothetical protein CCACVL1_23120 [Corchorus capsularis]
MNEVGGGTSGNSSDQDQEAISDEELEDDVGTLVDAAHTLDDPTLLKRLRRMLSNRESARRSRKRKQEHLADLEFQAEQLRGENDSLYKQLTNAHQQFRDADTNNRVLKSDVEALRAKVKLAEDMVGRGSLTCSLNQLIQSQLGSGAAINNVNLRRVPNVSPTITVHADDSSPYTLTRNSIGINAADAVSCVSDIWP